MEEKKPYYPEPAMDGSGTANPPPYYSPASPPPGAYTPAGVYPHLPQQGPPMPQAPAPQVTVAMIQPMGPQSTRTTCRFCNHDISTRVESNATSKTHLMALVLCLLGCWCCCCIPYCMDSCMNTDHYCPSCNAFLGSYTT